MVKDTKVNCMNVYNIEGKVINESKDNLPVYLINKDNGWPEDKDELTGGSELWGGGRSPSFSNGMGSLFMPSFMLKGNTSFYLLPCMNRTSDPKYYIDNTKVHYGKITKVEKNLFGCGGVFAEFKEDKDRIANLFFLYDNLLSKIRGEKNPKIEYRDTDTGKLVNVKLNLNLPFMAPVFFPEQRVSVNDHPAGYTADYLYFFREWKRQNGK